MKRLFIAVAFAALAAAGIAPAAWAFSPQSSAASHAITYLHSLQAPDGTVANDATRTEETAWGLAANGASVAAFSTSGKTTIDSLRSHIAAEEKSAGSIGSLILAVSAAGFSPANFAGHDLLQDLACDYQPATGAFNDQMYNDALAVLAIPPDQTPVKAIDYIRTHQLADGGWEFAAGYGSDSNTTAVALLALKSAGALTESVRVKALLYLKSQQRSDSGGFQYQTSTYTTDSDPDSDGLVIEALIASGQNPIGPSWSINDKNGLTDLLSFQFPNGGLGYSRPGSSATAGPDPLSTTQPLVALAATYLPVKVVTGAFPSTCQSATATAVPSPSATPAPSAATSPATTRLAPTGGSPLPGMAAALAGLLALVAGLGVRRRSH